MESKASEESDNSSLRYKEKVDYMKDEETNRETS